MIAQLHQEIQSFITSEFGVSIQSLEFQATRKDFEGDVTLVVFPLVKLIKGNPTDIARQIGQHVSNNTDVVDRFNVVGGFLNLVISDAWYLEQFNQALTQDNYGFKPLADEKAVMVEYASPNTNKPLHLGHIRNILLGYSVAKILEAAGHKVYQTQIVNDRGIHICKSMWAWKQAGADMTPENSGMKGDKLVGHFYVEFDKIYKEQINRLMADGMPEADAKRQAPALREAQKMLLDWEAGNPEILEMWRTMNGWVYEGFEATFKKLGVAFDKNYYESDTYLLGKSVVELGLEKGIFERDPDGSVWIDLTDEGLDRKIVLRSDGTAVYMTQDIGTAIQRVKDFPDVGGMVYTVGNEQDYHFKVLFLILKKLGFDWASNLYHLSYGMVDLPSGKMKSREGTVVDADDLIAEMERTARDISVELGKLDGIPENQRAGLYHMIGMGALKYYILKVDPKKRILFNPAESVDFAGNTGPFIQYTHARIRSVLRKAGTLEPQKFGGFALEPKEKELLKLLVSFPQIIQEAAASHSPAVIANFTYELVREYNSFYQSVPILGEPDEHLRHFRIALSGKIAAVIASAFGLLGIGVPEKM